MYLDHAATSVLRPDVLEAMSREWARVGNPSSLHEPGRAARRVVEECRERLADALGARPSEVLFTSGGTESDNIGVLGGYRARRAVDPARRRLLVGAAEHSAVLDAAEHLARSEGALVTLVPPGRDGVSTAEAFVAAAHEGEGGPDAVALAACLWVNNEVGTVTDVPGLASALRELGIPLHTDAVQAAGRVPVDFAGSGAATAAVTAHKLGGPTGIGVLLAQRDAALQPLSYGGGQERGVRSGTLPAALVVGLEAAVTSAVAQLPTEAPRLAALRDRILDGVLAAVPGARVTGAWERGEVSRRSPANAHVLVPDCEGDSLLFLLDAAGIACSTGSACHAGVPQPSHVVLAMGYTEAEARGALRLSLGWSSTDADVDALLDVLPDAVARAQRAHAAASARAS